MRIRSVRGSHFNRSPDRQPTHIQTANQFRLALEWRDCWRAEKLKDQNGTAGHVRKEKDKPGEPDKEDRKRFAEGIARAEFGRAYWDERRQRDVQREPARTGKARLTAAKVRRPGRAKANCRPRA
jgi:hypothetical protein